MDIVVWLLLGLVAGILSGLFGVGGGFLLVPLLALAGWKLPMAIGTSLAYVAAMGISGAITHHRRGNLDLKFVATSASTSIVGAQLGAYGAAVLPEAWLALAFAAFLGYVAWSIRPTAELEEEGEGTAPPLVPTLLLGLTVGVLSGLFGVGGGLLFVPAQVKLFKIPYKRAVGNSLAAVLVTGLSGVAGHVMYGHVAWMPALILVIGGVGGMLMGTKLLHRLSVPRLKGALTVFLVAMAGYMAFRGVEHLL